AQPLDLVPDAVVLPGARQRRQRQPDAPAADPRRPGVQALGQQGGMIAGDVDDDFIDVGHVGVFEGVEETDAGHLDRPAEGVLSTEYRVPGSTAALTRPTVADCCRCRPASRAVVSSRRSWLSADTGTKRPPGL